MGDNFYDKEENFDIAVIGMSCNFPGAKNIEEYWDNLIHGRESITFFEETELIANGLNPQLINQPEYVKAAPVLEGPDMFDASFFGYSPAEAKIIDPQQRLLLECAWEALENAGYNTSQYTDPIGIFAGTAMNTYFMNDQFQSDFVTNYIPTLIANDKDFLCTRISYKLNLRGPSVTVQTACSTALVAVHMACQSVLNQECEIALAGAMSVKVPHIAGYFYHEGGVVSSDGHCRPFDAKADGCIFGSGGGMVVLKRLNEALKDGDQIHAIIKGSAINNDGAEKAGYTAPSVKSQANVVLEAQANAGIDPETVTFVEAHGSGTSIGDPIEVEALSNAFRAGTQKTNFCALGSVKGNIGHLDVAAGMAGLIKTIMALKHKIIPPTLHFTEPNPLIDFANNPFYVNNETLEWESLRSPRRAGVCASGMGGTNAHIVLEEAPEPVNGDQRKINLLILSAKTKEALDSSKKNLLHHFKKNPDQNISDIAFTLQVGRNEFNHRCFLACRNTEEAIVKLESGKEFRHDMEKSAIDANRPLIFLFPGIGDHYVGMGFDLYQNESFFRQEVDHCAEILKKYIDLDIRSVLYPESFLENKNNKLTQGIDLRKMLLGNQQPKDEATVRINQSICSQTALFTIEYALASLWMHWGIKPDRMIGHSLGEYVAACIAGVFSLEDALFIVSQRAQLVQKLPLGAMLAVTLSEQELQPFLKDELSLSLINGPSLCIVTGPEGQVAALEDELNQNNVITRRVENSHAFHSKMMEPIVAPFIKVLHQVTYSTPRIPYISNVSGKWINNSEALDPGYWAKHATHTVRFNDALNLLWAESPDSILVEVGPGLTLSTLAIQHSSKDKNSKAFAVSSIRPVYNQQEDTAYIQTALGKLWLNGYPIDWEMQYKQVRRQRISLPTYPFERKRHWHKDQSNNGRLVEKSEKDPLTAFNEWFYVPSWKRAASLTPLDPGEMPTSCWLIFMDTKGIGLAIAEKVILAGHQAIKVYAGQDFKGKGDKVYEINPESSDAYHALFNDLASNHSLPAKIIHCWSLEDATGLDQVLNNGFYSLFYLAQALGEQAITHNTYLAVLSDQLHEITGKEKLIPEKATISGICKVIPKEYSNVVCKNIDIVLSDILLDSMPDFAASILAEVNETTPHSVIAYRGNHRWTEDFERLYLKETAPEKIENTRLKHNGVYVITGGLGGLGIFLADYIAEAVKAKLVLIGRADFPDKKDWEKWLEMHEHDNPVSEKIKKIQRMEEKGAEVIIASADVGNKEQMKSLFSRVLEKFGPVNGVLHAAGVMNEGVIQWKKKDEISQVLHPKVTGTLALFDILQEQPPDFFLLFSSLATFMAPAGDVDYCAANAFLDAFAQAKSGKNSFVHSVNWPVWKEIGTLARHQKSDAVRAWNKKILETAIAPEEGIAVLKAILALNLSQVVVSKGDFPSMVREVESFNAFGLFEKFDISSDKNGSDEKKRSSDYDAPRNETEEIVAQCWREVFGIDHIGIHDNFSNLGGHSLLATQIISRLRNAFKKKISVADILDAPTISQIAEHIDTGSYHNEEQIMTIKPISRGITR